MVESTRVDRLSRASELSHAEVLLKAGNLAFPAELLKVAAEALTKDELQTVDDVLKTDRSLLVVECLTANDLLAAVELLSAVELLFAVELLSVASDLLREDGQLTTDELMMLVEEHERAITEFGTSQARSVTTGWPQIQAEDVVQEALTKLFVRGAGKKLRKRKVDSHANEMSVQCSGRKIFFPKWYFRKMVISTAFDQMRRIVAIAEHLCDDDAGSDFLANVESKDEAKKALSAIDDCQQCLDLIRLYFWDGESLTGIFKKKLMPQFGTAKAVQRAFKRCIKRMKDSF